MNTAPKLSAAQGSGAAHALVHRMTGTATPAGLGDFASQLAEARAGAGADGVAKEPPADDAANGSPTADTAAQAAGDIPQPDAAPSAVALAIAVPSSGAPTAPNDLDPARHAPTATDPVAAGPRGAVPGGPAAIAAAGLQGGDSSTDRAAIPRATAAPVESAPDDAALAGPRTGPARARRVDTAPATLAARMAKAACPAQGRDIDAGQPVTAQASREATLSTAQQGDASGTAAPAVRPPAPPAADAVAASATSARAPEVASAAPAADAPAPATTAAYAEARLSPHPGSPQFAPALGQQIQVFVREGIQHARLHLNPEDMGPISVRISVDGDAAKIMLTAEMATTRQTLEQAMPVLASSLREEGLTLMGGGVFEQPRDPGRQATGSGEGTRARASRDTEPTGIDAAPAADRAVPRRTLGALDVYA